MTNFRRRLMMSIKTTAEKVNKDPAKYYGKSITNYSANGVTQWKIFHSDGKNVYLIAADYIDLDKLPTTVAGHKPANINSSHPKTASFDNIMNDYTGSTNIIDERIKALNSDYFIKGYTSTGNNMKEVAYMLDTGIWSSFKTEKADYAIGGPTVEMLMASYSKKYNVDYRARANTRTGYEISKDGGANWANSYSKILSTSDSLYVITSEANATAMWIASPSFRSTNFLINVAFDGGVYYSSTSNAFRPLVCLKSNISLKAVEDGYEIL